MLKRWIFRDLDTGSATTDAGSEPGEIPLTLDGLEMTAPEHPLKYPPIGLA
jgi:hypothetical protein